MPSYSSHLNFLLYFQKMLVNVRGMNERDLRDHRVGMAAILKGRPLQGPPLASPAISPVRIDLWMHRKN